MKGHQHNNAYEAFSYICNCVFYGELLHVYDYGRGGMRVICD